MTPTETASDAERLGFQLQRLDVDGDAVWTWRRGTECRWPVFRTEDEAITWMQHALQSTGPFDP
jgi:hypothetical protein